MKKLIAATLLIGTTTAFASCPQFNEKYLLCESTDSSVKTESISVKMRDPFYRFSFHTGNSVRRMNVVTDGSPRDVTIQTQEGSESTYIETASCADNKLKVLRTSEENDSTQETVFYVQGFTLHVSSYENGVLENTTSCYAPQQ